MKEDLILSEILLSYTYYLIEQLDDFVENDDEEIIDQEDFKKWIKQFLTEKPND